MYYNKLIIITVLCIVTTICWSGTPITIDGLFDDWISVPVALSDIAGDGIDEDFAELKVTNDNDFLFLKFSFHNREHLLQDLNEIRLYIDTDYNSQSGLQIYDIGAELEWCFGRREGIYHSPDGPISIGQADIVLRSSPTITAMEFEIALSLKSDPMTISTKYIPDSIAITLVTSAATDLIPDQPGGYLFVIDTNEVEAAMSIPLKREQAGHIRVLTYNTLGSGLFDLNRQEMFHRIIKALDPDILAFQEQGNADETISLIRDWLRERYIYGIGLGNNNVIVSKYPVLYHALITASGRTMAVLLQTESVMGKNILILNSHLACCTNNVSRQRDADEIIMVLRNWYAGNGPFPLMKNTPVIHLGDFNLVGFSQQLKTLTEGDIEDESNFGSDFYPDWDDSPLLDLFSVQTANRMGYTWRDDKNEFSPGKLDYMLYTDSIIEIGNHYILNTLAMSHDDLDKYGLLSDDTNMASDHLPRVMDIASVNPLLIPDKVAIPDNFQLFQASPNPFNPSTKIQYSISQSTHVTLKVYNLIGHQVSVLVDQFVLPGTYSVIFKANDLASGIYYYVLANGNDHQIKKMMLIK